MRFRTLAQIYKACGSMDQPDLLPFKPGQLAESKSFKVGFRGAWFRCKIQKTNKRKVEGVQYTLEYYDFPEEKVTCSRAYQKPYGSKSEPRLMLRPQFPPIYSESEVPDVNIISEVSVVKKGVWKVGDEVDWYTDGCYWSGRVTKILTKEKVQIELPPPPEGEGLTYDVNCKDLRPSLNWSLEHGWSVCKGGENGDPCARLIKPVDKGPRITKFDALCETAGDFQSVPGSSLDSSFSSDTSSSMPLDVHKRERVTKKLVANSIAGNSCSDNVSTSQIRDFSARNNGDEDDNSSGPTKRTRTSVPLNSTKSDTVGAAILDLEEMVNKVKWLKGILQCGAPSSNTRRATWEFVECLASYKRKK